MIPSCSTITWGEMKTEAEFKNALSEIKRIGYTDAGIEFAWLPPALRKDPKKAGALTRASGLTVSAVAIDTSPSMVGIVGAFDSPVGWLCLFEKDIDVAIEKTKKLTSLGAKAGVSVSLHPHVKSNILTTEDLDKVMKACAPSPVSVTVDTAHFTALDIDIPKFIARYKSKISLVHMKDLRAKIPQQDVNYSTDFVDLGDGVADLKGTIKALKKIGYEGAVMVEVDYPHDVTIEASSKKSYKVLESLLRSFG